MARLGWGLLWCWVVLTAWVCSLGLIYLARFLQGRWRQMRVIEPELAP
jgi:MATE family multidrug resistance protein